MAQMLISKSGAWYEVTAIGNGTPTDPGSGNGGGTPIDFIEPTAANTGTSGTLTTVTGDYHLTVGETLANKDITGVLYPAANTRVTNCKAAGLYTVESAVGITISRCTFGTWYTDGLKTVSIDHCQFGVGVRNVSTSQINRNADPGHCDDLQITNSFFTGAPIDGGYSGAHLEPIHLMGVSNAVFRNNTFDALYANDAATIPHISSAFQMEAGPFSDLVWIDGNYFYGGGFYQAYFNGRRTRITNNKFHWNSRLSGIAYPPSAYGPGTWTQLLDVTGNTLDGAPFALPNPPSH
ncbi:MAG: hypothetical protein JWM93_2026 [Frankiales bacterium]|nr:hypothetical protein [Frankiales bacterium]